MIGGVIADVHDIGQHNGAGERDEGNTYALAERLGAELEPDFGLLGGCEALPDENGWPQAEKWIIHSDEGLLHGCALMHSHRTVIDLLALPRRCAGRSAVLW